MVGTMPLAEVVFAESSVLSINRVQSPSMMFGSSTATLWILLSGPDNDY